jgi:hypothetical protein
MKFIVAITHRSGDDSDGKGWAMPSVAKEFNPDTPIMEIWTWYMAKSKDYGGLLEIMYLD